MFSHVKEELWECSVSCEPDAEPAQAVRVGRCLQEMGNAGGTGLRSISQDLLSANRRIAAMLPSPGAQHWVPVGGRLFQLASLLGLS